MYRVKIGKSNRDLKGMDVVGGGEVKEICKIEYRYWDNKLL